MWDRSYSDDDSKLAGRARKGDQLAFEELVQKYQQTVFNLVYHNIGYCNDVEDVVQKIFSKIYFSLPKFNTRRPFFPWMYRIAVNQCYDELRQARRRRIHTFSELNLEEASSIENLISKNEIPPPSEENRQELYALLHRMLGQLPDQQRIAVVLRDLEGVSYVKMAEILECTEQAARLKVFRGRARLKELMEKALRRQESVRRGK